LFFLFLYCSFHFIFPSFSEIFVLACWSYFSQLQRSIDQTCVGCSWALLWKFSWVKIPCLWHPALISPCRIQFGMQFFPMQATWPVHQYLSLAYLQLVSTKHSYVPSISQFEKRKFKEANTFHNGTLMNPDKGIPINQSWTEFFPFVTEVKGY